MEAAGIAGRIKVEEISPRPVKMEEISPRPVKVEEISPRPVKVEEVSPRPAGGGGGEMEIGLVGPRTPKLDGHVGFASLPDQIVAATVVRKGYVFNILCIGESGIGKSTLIDSLFNMDTSKSDGALWCPNNPAVNLETRQYDLDESGIQLKLTIVESVGFGDQINKEDSYKAIETYIDEQFEAYFREELEVQRCLPMYRDTRIHACLYFICPTGANGLKAVDLLCMKRLHEKVNIIPVIGKADALSKTELKKFKEIIMRELKRNEIKVYDFPSEDDTTSNASVDLPFAVVGSRDYVQVGNKRVRGRQYPWGNVLVENEVHCDFVKLREMMIRTSMEDLKETTHQYHYENYRMMRLIQMGLKDEGTDFQEMCQRKLQTQNLDLMRAEAELKESFVVKIQEKEKMIKEAEQMIRERYELLKEEQLNETKKLDDLNKQLEAEIIEFRTLTGQHLSQAQSPSNKKLSNHHSFSLGSLGRSKRST